MRGDSQTFIYLPGAAGGGERDLAAFASGLDYSIHFETIRYPGWRRYVQDDFSAEALIAELTAEVVSRAPTGTIRLMGMSLGGHLGYAVALRLQELGREIAVFCVIDSFMVSSSEASTGWQRRAISDALDLLRKGRFADFAILIRSKAWRALMRLAGGRLAGALRAFSKCGAPLFRGDGVAEQELSMRLLLRQVAPRIAEFDRIAAPMTAPTILLRTQASSGHDPAWRVRCPHIEIRQVPGKHLTLFEPENIGGLRDAFVEAADQLAAWQ